ncbi:YidC/Oxa1 family membrane protein insertase [Clostridium sp. SHJSY1]|uniref:membrane protein insertase YidC n=1 Tax=Clostridium sp. SHJSY1 TaxID=2942483 RepID=UPI002875AB6B|nr:membrane protein insertase YidC [Clostridium sp. SHJSY1]MDS0526177.1 YidC/Oxa1 family membrane protein insertase [Clostridium sp. SHJSY1]
MNIISEVLKNSLNYFFSITGDLGIAIILLTILVKFLLVPISFKQKISMQKSQKISLELEKIKEKYKNNKKKLEQELQKHYEKSAKGVFGGFIILLQLPIIYALYHAVLSMDFQVGTILVPWVTNLNMADGAFIIPIIYVMTALSSNILYYIPFFKISAQAKLSKANIIMTSVMSIIITIKAPVAISLYFIASSLFSFVEEIVFRIYIRRKEITI